MNEIEDAMVGQTDSKAVVVMFASDSYGGDDEWALTQAQAAWLRDRIDEELALLDGGRVAPDTPATDEIDVDRHPPSEMMGSPAYHTQQDEDEGGDPDDDVQDEVDAEEVPGGEDGIGERTCPECDEEFKSARGVAVHRGKVHGDDADGDDDADAAAAAEGNEDGPEPEADEDGGEDEGDPGAAALRRRLDEREKMNSEQKGDDDRVNDDPRNGGGNLPDTEYSCPVCGESFDDVNAIRAHRDDDHDETEVARAQREQVREDLPRNVSIADVEQSVAAHGTLYEVQQDLRIPRSQLKTMVGKLQLTDALEEHSETQAIHMIEDLHDELGIDEPVPEVPATDGGESG